MLLRLAAIAFVLAASAGAAADEPREKSHDRAFRELKAGGIVPLHSILDWVAARFEGDVIEVELEPEDDDVLDSPLIYEVELLTRDGTVIELIFDPKTGALLRHEGAESLPVRKTP